MTIWHRDHHKRKKTGGKKGIHRKKRRSERGRSPVQTMSGEPERVVIRTRGGNTKTVLVSDKFANVYDTRSGKIVRTEITRVKANQANRDFERRGVITKGAIIETKIGDARVVSKPGSDGVINAILLIGSPA